MGAAGSDQFEALSRPRSGHSRRIWHHCARSAASDSMNLHRLDYYGHDNIGTGARIGRALARLALLATLGAALVALAAGPAYRHELAGLGLAIGALRGAVWVALGGAAAALLALLFMLPSRRRHGGAASAICALLIGTAVAAPPLLLYRQARELPPIHDISTDLRNPPRFVTLEPARRMAPNGVDYPAESQRLQGDAYPDIQTFEIATPLTPTFQRALRAAEAMDWQIVSVAPADGRIEATAHTLMFGFKDDVVIRVSAAPQGSKVDVRSASRVGRSDLGANAKRIRAYLREFASAEASD